MLHDFRRNFALAQIRRIRGRHLHADVFRKRFKLRFRRSGFVRVELYHYADSAGRMDIGRHHAVKAGEAANLDVLADGEDLLAQQFRHGHLGADGFDVHQGIDIRRFFRQHGIGAGFHERAEIGIFRNKIGLGIDLDDHTGLAVGRHFGVRNAFGRDAAGFLRGSRQTLFAQEVDGRVHVTVGCRQRFFAIHHAAAGFFAQRSNIFRCKIH